MAGFLRGQVLPAFGSVPLNRITRNAVQMWVDEMATRLAPRTVRDSYRFLAGLLREAVRQGLLRQSPATSSRSPPWVAGEPRYLSAEEVERLADAIDPRYRSLIYTDAYLGLRWSELRAVKRTSLGWRKDRWKHPVSSPGSQRRTNHPAEKHAFPRQGCFYFETICWPPSLVRSANK